MIDTHVVKLLIQPYNMYMSVSVFFDIFFRWIHDYQDACIDKLNSFIHGLTPIEPAEPINQKGVDQSVLRHPPGKRLVRICSLASEREASLTRDIPDKEDSKLSV